MKTVQELFESFSKTVLLVGNGPIKDKAELIDSYETVIRFNTFEIEGYEKDVGSKISAISFHTNDLKIHKNATYLMPNYQKYVDKVPIFTLSSSVISKYRIIVLQHATKMLSVDPPIKEKPTTRLTSGSALALNLALFFDKEVHLIGFDFLKNGHYFNAEAKPHDEHLKSKEEIMLPKVKGITIL